MRISSRGEVDPFIAMDVMGRAAQLEAEGRHIIHMEVGQPGTMAPAGARDALRSALDDDAMGYTTTRGLPELREKISGLYKDWYGVDVDPGRIIATNGSSAAFLLSFSSLFEAGDRVGIGSPGYPSYRQIMKAMNLEPVIIETGAEARYQPQPKDLEGRDIQGLMVASPGNPSGTMLSRGAMEDLIGATQERDIAFISDEIYHGLHYDEPAVSALEISDDVYVINSFSKYFSMTGWRIGWMIVPESHIRHVERLAQHMFICAPTPSQVAAIGALDSIEELEANRAVYARNRALMMRHLPEAGFTRIAPPDGGFYVYADVSDITHDSGAFARELLDVAGVAVTPGLDFDATRGRGTLRFSYAAATEDIEEGLARLKSFMRERARARA